MTVSFGPSREPVESHPEHLPGATFRAWLRRLGTTEAKPFVEMSRSGTGVVGAETDHFHPAGRSHPLTEGFGQKGFTQPFRAEPLGYDKPAHGIGGMVVKRK